MRNHLPKRFPWGIFIGCFLIGCMFPVFGNAEEKNLRGTTTDGFIENKGQLVNQFNAPAKEVLFYGGGLMASVFITNDGISYVFKDLKENEKKRKGFVVDWSKITMQLVGANIDPQKAIFENASSQQRNYYKSHCPVGITDVKLYKKLTFEEIYPNIDWVLYCVDENNFKYDFVLRPGARVSDIKMHFEGGKGFDLKATPSELKLITPKGEVTEGQLFTYYKNSRLPIACQYQMKGDLLGFRFSEPIDNETVVIDPPLELRWATLFGEGAGSVSGPKSIAVDDNGNLFLTGYTSSEFFPTTNTVGNSYFDGTLEGMGDTWVSKFSVDRELLWSTYYGGNDLDFSESIACAGNGDVFVAGYTHSNNFPTVNPPGVGAYYQSGFGGLYDAFILQFDNDGRRKWATFLGGDLADVINDVKVDQNGDLLLIGTTSSNNFPTVDPGANAYMDAQKDGPDDSFIARFNENGVAQWITLFGGDNVEAGYGIEVNSTGAVFVVGSTRSNDDFPLMDMGNGAYYQSQYGGRYADGFLAKFSSQNALLWSSFIGGDQNDLTRDVASREDGSIVVLGSSQSDNFPMFPNAAAYFQGSRMGGNDGVLMEFDPSGQLIWSTFLSGSAIDDFSELEVFPDNSIVVNGKTNSTDIITVDAGYGYYQANPAAGTEGIFMAFDNARSLTWSTYYGGTGPDWGNALAVSDTCVFFTGEVTTSSQVTTFDPGGGAFYQPQVLGTDNGFIVQFCGCQKPVLEFAGDTAVCHGEEAILQVQGGDDYLWFDGSTADSIAFTPSQTAYVRVQSSLLEGCSTQDSVRVVVLPLPIPEIEGDTVLCLGDSSLFVASGASYYLWNGVVDADSIWYAPANSTVLYLEAESDRGCGTVDSIQILVYQNPDAIISGDSLLCSGDELSLTATGGISYVWSTGAVLNTIMVSPSSDSLFWVEVSDGMCVSTDSLWVNVLTSPAVDLSGPDEICEGDTLHLEAGGANSYLWWNGEVGDHQSIFLSNDTLVQVFGNVGDCVGEDSLFVRFKSKPVVEIVADTAVCFGRSVVLLGIGANYYEWSTGTTEETLLAVPHGDSTFTVHGYLDGCVDSDSVHIRVLPNPVADLLFFPAEPELGQEVFFSANSSSDVIQWNWEIGEHPFRDTTPDVNYHFWEEGSYWVLLEVVNQSGCLDTVKHQISVIDFSRQTMFIPNAFSPNGDGINDQFLPVAENITIVRFEIYNRWGELIHLEEGDVRGWNGDNKDSGKKAPQGVYNYRVYWEKSSIKQVESTGQVVVLY